MVSFTKALFLGLAALVSAQDPNFNPIYTPADSQAVTVGTTVPITWQVKPIELANEPVKIVLIGGQTQGTQVELYTIVASTANSGSYSWTVSDASANLPFYGLIISLVSDPTRFQYSNPFQVVSAAGVSTTKTTTATATAPQTTSSSSSSSVVVTAAGSTTITLATSSAADAVTTVVASATTTVPCTTSSAIYVPHGNSSVVVVPPPATHVTTVAPVHSAGSNVTIPTLTSFTSVIATAPGAGAVPSGLGVSGAGRVAGASFALLGAAAVAVLAL